jgi:hypothetical protein
VALTLAVAVLHATTILLLLTGALLALRYKRVLVIHLPVAAAVTSVHVVGADCPLTTWERALRARSGQSYDGGFLDHYVFGPLGLDTAEPAVSVGVYVVVVLPNLIGYALLATRSLHRDVASPV